MSSKEGLIMLNDLLSREFPAPLYKVGNNAILIENGVAMLYGSPGAGKTALALHWACELAVQGRKVIYALLEGEWDFVKSRLPSSLNYYDRDLLQENMRFVEVEIDLYSQEHLIRWQEWIQQARFYPELAIIDTLNQSYKGISENDNSGMAEIIRNSRTLAPSILLLHHPGKNGDDYRGASSIQASVDASYRAIKVDDDKILLKGTKQRWGNPNDVSLGYTLEFGDYGAIARPSNIVPTHQNLRDDQGTEIIVEAIQSGLENIDEIMKYTQLKRKKADRLLGQLVNAKKIQKMRAGKKFIYRITPTRELSGQT